MLSNSKIFEIKRVAFFLGIFVFLTGNLFSQKIGTELGNTAPEIRLPNLKGDTISLYAQRGKIILIDFWGTWCAPCVKEQPELLKLYNKYKSAGFKAATGFDIFGLSLDNKKKSLEAIIKKYKIPWIQVSDFLFWMSPVAQTYNLQELPFNLLLDANGIIIAKNLHGEELDHFLAKLLK